MLNNVECTHPTACLREQEHAVLACIECNTYAKEYGSSAILCIILFYQSDFLTTKNIRTSYSRPFTNKHDNAQSPIALNFHESFLLLQ